MLVDDNKVRLINESLGVLGLIPVIVSTTGLVVYQSEEVKAEILFVINLYACLIASLLGAVHWGVAITKVGSVFHW